MRIFLFIGVAAFALGCANQKNIVDNAVEEEVVEEVVEEIINEEEATSSESTNEDANTDSKPQRPYQVRGEIGDVGSKTDPFDIVSARIDGNNLYVDITYTGGCAYHKFKCFGSEAISKSLPPQRTIKLIHEDDNDTCESLVKQTIEIDIRAFALSAAESSEIVLLLEGYSVPLNYKN